MTDLQTVSRTSALMTASLAAMAWSASANAQTATSSPAAPHFAATAAENQPAVQGRADASGAVQAPSGGAGDIVVTARKRQELARDVPISILAVSGDKLAERNVLRLTDLVTVAPNFTLSLGGGQPATYLRGFGTYGTTFAQSVGKFVDNVSYGRDIHSRLPLFDIQRVEVLNGPQVLLYGNSTTAGAINITTKTPGDKFSVDALVSHEFNFHETTIDASVTVPVTETLSIRGALFYQDLNKGWLHNTSTNQDDPRFRNRGYRGTALFKPTPNLEIKVKGEFTSVRDRGSNGQQIKQSTNPNRQLTDVTFDDNRQAAIAGAPFFAPEFYGVNNTVVQGDIDWKTGLGTLHSTTAYLDTHQSSAQSSSSGRPDIAILQRTDYKQFSQELRLTGDLGRVDYLIGGYYEHNDYNVFGAIDLNPPGVNIPLPGVGRYLELVQKNRSYSSFGDLTWHITNKLNVEIGARYTKLNQSNDQTSDAVPLITNFSFSTRKSQIKSTIDPALRPLLVSLFGGTPHELYGIDRNESHLQPQAIIQYRPNRDLMLYAKFVQGDKQGGVDFSYNGTATGAPANRATFAPEGARSFEIGLKGVTANRALEYSLDLFQTRFKDLQLSAFQGTTVFVTNVGKAVTRGVEAEVIYRPVSRLTIDATGNYLDAEYRDFPGAPCTVAQTLATPAGQICSQNLSGAPTPFQSKWSGTLNISYGYTAGNFEITPTVSVLGRSSYNVSTNNDPLARQSALALIDLNLAVLHTPSGVRASIFAKNITNKKYLEYGVATSLIPGAFTVYSSRGATVGLQLGWHF